MTTPNMNIVKELVKVYTCNKNFWISFDISDNDAYTNLMEIIESLKTKTVAGFMYEDEINEFIREINLLHEVFSTNEEEQYDTNYSNQVEPDELAHIVFLVDKYIEDTYGDSLEESDEETLKNDLVEFAAWSVINI